MKLSLEQINDLRQLTESRGYKVLELIEEQATNDLGRQLLTSKLTDADIEVIKTNQIYMKSRQDFFRDTQKYLNKIYTPKV